MATRVESDLQEAGRPERVSEASSRSALGSSLPLLSLLLIASVVGTPILIPHVTGNSVPVDLINLLFIVLLAAAAWRSRVELRAPLGFSYLLILCGGVLATTQSIVPATSALAIIQDGYLFVWFLAVVNFLVHARESVLRAAAVTWAFMTGAVGSLVWLVSLGYPDDVPVLLGYSTVDRYGRSEGTFRDPNMAANYLVVSLFVLWAAPALRTKTKIMLTIPALVGIYATHSITGLVALVGGAFIALTVATVGRREIVVALGLAALAFMVMLIALFPQNFANKPATLVDRAGSQDVFSDSLGRAEASLEMRSRRWQDALNLFGSDVLLGIGPAATATALWEIGAENPNEIHNDLIAGLLERGVIGVLGVLSLFAMASWWTLRVALDREVVRRGWRPAAFAGGVVAVLISALSLETLHFRHVWLLFAMVIALGIRQRFPRGKSASRVGPDLLRGEVAGRPHHPPSTTNA